MTGKPTGILDRWTRGTPSRETHTWNGVPEDKMAAKQVFEKAIKSGQYLASVVEGPGKARQVHTWDEVEATELKEGVVVVALTPALRGG